MTTTAQLKAAAANPTNWKPVPASEAIARNLREDDACEKVDKLIMALLDLVPDNLSLKALDIYEHLITPNTETQEHLALAFELIALAPFLAYHSQAQALLSELMLAAGRHVVSLITLIGKRLNGWYCA